MHETDVISDAPSRRVLVVDDDADQRESLKTLLELKGYAVDTAENGEDALRKLLHGGRYDAALLDLMMPVMDGWTFRAELAKNPALAKLPVIVISGVAQLDAAKRIDAVAHLRKPVALPELYRLLERHCVPDA
jgi:CheY-like chemotaxis protein